MGRPIEFNFPPLLPGEVLVVEESIWEKKTGTTRTENTPFIVVDFKVKRDEGEKTTFVILDDGEGRTTTIAKAIVENEGQIGHMRFNRIEVHDPS